MLISVKDIEEKTFDIVTENGYSMEQVDDFLDELAGQWTELIRENLALSEQIKQLQQSVAEAQAATAEMEKRLPDYNEKAYFKNLESAVRESLIGAQRIADETVSEAKRQAQQTVDDANAAAQKTTADAQATADKAIAEAEAHAKSITENAQGIVDGLNADAERLRKNIADYKTKLKTLIDEQLASLTGSEG